ncbi:ATP-binding cassette domain-containing protein [Thalassotalea ponticola]|uniref:ATP-binding cassette domain-containing protein n=1 Tax=Thalassotalea ponticola TaxID=1523392 RepID=UPI0025B297ED|nr:ATP-binding cassette domain-containing protein [Thalassotalea ponticola]MDN3652817.1 ATP-binding cassette domain-containing protein [Thalassotalea ponticola]
MIKASQITLDRGVKTLISDSSFTIYPGHKVGLVGKNGCGKSSLFAAILGQLQVDKGNLDIPKQWAVATVKQETPALIQSAIDYVIDGDQQFRALEKQLSSARQANNGALEATLLDQIDAINGYSLNARAGELLHGLGFTQDQLTEPVKSFSGGWRMRLNLAQALISRADLMLLDEPTNHLDLDAVLWLQKWLNRYQGTLVLISHDRDFLDAVVNEVLHIEHATAKLYNGNYSAFERQRAEHLAQQDAMYQKQVKERQQLTAFVDRFRAKASKAKQAQSRLKRLEKLPDLTPAHVDSQFSFEFSNPSYMPYPLLSLENSDCGYGDEAKILSQVSLNLVPGSRIGLLGRNGAGKSTLIKSLAGELALMSGTRFSAQELNIGYFSQHQLEQLHTLDTAVNQVLLAHPSLTEQQARNHLGRFGFSGDQALSVIDTMSGGEKARLVLALIVLDQPQLLLLDEPTNHLDLEMRQALVLALQNFNGAIILIAHDRYLLESCVDEFYLVGQGLVQPFDGDIDDYQKWLDDDKKALQSKQNPTDNVDKVDKKEQRRLQAELRKKAAPLKKQADKLEQQIESWQQSLDEIEQQMADPATYDEQNKDKLSQLLKQQSELKPKLEQAEETWMTLLEQIEDIMAAE